MYGVSGVNVWGECKGCKWSEHICLVKNPHLLYTGTLRRWSALYPGRSNTGGTIPGKHWTRVMMNPYPVCKL